MPASSPLRAPLTDPVLPAIAGAVLAAVAIVYVRGDSPERRHSHKWPPA